MGINVVPDSVRRIAGAVSPVFPITPLKQLHGAPISVHTEHCSTSFTISLIIEIVSAQISTEIPLHCFKIQMIDTGVGFRWGSGRIKSFNVC